MTTLSAAKLAAGAVGLLLWGYGARADAAEYQWVGIALVFAAFLLRFVTRDERQPESEAAPDDER